MGNRIAQVDANHHRTEFEYDALGRMTKMIYPGGDFESNGYDEVGNMLWKRTANNDTIRFEYNTMNRMRLKRYPDGSTFEYTYTKTGRRKTVTDYRGTTQYTYNKMDRLERIDYPEGKYIEYDYDDAGNRIRIATANGSVDYEYDKLNRLTKVVDVGDITMYDYDSVGNRKKITNPNNTYAEYTYDNVNRLIKLENRKSNNEVISVFDYELGPTGIREQIIENNGMAVDTLDYEYDEVYRLTNEKRSGTHAYEIGYEYDKVGNRLKKIMNADTTRYTYNNRDQLLKEILNSDTVFYDYDLNGNTTQKRTNGITTGYQYDFENRLSRAEENGSLLAEYEYDPDGNRIKKATSMDTTSYLIDPNQPLAQVLGEYDNAGGLIVAYLYGDDLIKQKRGGTKSYFHYDGLGSTRALTDNLGQLTDTYIFKAFGELLAQTGMTENNYLFTGEQFDPNIGFYYLRARLYNPAIGRFLTVDPFAGSIYDPLSLHKYLYCGADPVNKIDPSGLFTLPEISNVTMIIITTLTIMSTVNIGVSSFFLKGAMAEGPWTAFVVALSLSAILGFGFLATGIGFEMSYELLFIKDLSQWFEYGAAFASLGLRGGQ